MALCCHVVFYCYQLTYVLSFVDFTVTALAYYLELLYIFFFYQEL
jgi:hypothetical protein